MPTNDPRAFILGSASFTPYGTMVVAPQDVSLNRLLERRPCAVIRSGARWLDASDVTESGFYWVGIPRGISVVRRVWNYGEGGIFVDCPDGSQQPIKEIRSEIKFQRVEPPTP